MRNRIAQFFFWLLKPRWIVCSDGDLPTSVNSGNVFVHSMKCEKLMKKHHKPPQGTHGPPRNPEKEESFGWWAVAKELDGSIAHLQLINDPDYQKLIQLKKEGMLYEKRYLPFLQALYLKHERKVVGLAFNYLKFLPRDMI